MERTTYYCPKCGKPLTLFEDTGAFTCTNCDAKMQLINGELRMQVSPDPAFAEASEPAVKAPHSKRILAGILVPVIGLLTCITCACTIRPGQSTLTLYPLIGTLLSAPFLLYAFGLIPKPENRAVWNRIALTVVILIMDFFTLDFVCRLILDIVIYI